MNNKRVKAISVIITLFTLYCGNVCSVFGSLAGSYYDLSDVYAFPVPFTPSVGHTKITFANLSSEATIKIYNLSGCLVKTLSETDGDQVYDWCPVENDDGIEIASGIYIYMIYNCENVKIGKLIITR